MEASTTHHTVQRLCLNIWRYTCGRVYREHRRELAFLGLVLAALGWGGAFIAGKLALREISVLTASAWRYVFAAAVLIPFAVRHAGNVSLSNSAGALFIMFLCGGLMYPLLFMTALERTSATNTSLIVALMPVLTLFLCPLIGESVSRRRWFAAFVALGGAAVVISRGEIAVLVGLSSFNPGDVFALAAAGVWAVFNLASRRAVVELPTSVINAILYGSGGAIMMILALPEMPLLQLQDASSIGWGSVLFLAIVPSVFSGHLYLNAMRVLGVSRSVVFIYCVPFVTAALASLFLGETINRYQTIGGVLIFAGLVLAVDLRMAGVVGGDES